MENNIIELNVPNESDKHLRYFYIFLSLLVLSILLLLIVGQFFYAIMLGLVIGVIAGSIALLYWMDYRTKPNRVVDLNYVKYIVLNYLIAHPHYHKDTNTDSDILAERVSHAVYEIISTQNVKGKLHKAISILDNHSKEPDQETKIITLTNKEIQMQISIDVLKLIYSEIYAAKY